MALPLVATKLNLPLLRPHVVARPRFRALLDRSLETKLTLGDSVLWQDDVALRHWLTRSTPPGLAVAWLSLDGSDSEPSVLWPHVVAALQAAFAWAGAAFPDLPSAMQPDQGLVAILLNQLTPVNTHRLDPGRPLQHPIKCGNFRDGFRPTAASGMSRTGVESGLRQIETDGSYSPMAS